MKPSRRIVLDYACDQSLEDMKPTKEGHYCDFCKKNIIDFRHYSIKEIQNYSVGKENLCGRFTMKQLEPDLISPEELISPLKKYAAIILSFISIELAGAPSSDTNKIKTTQTISPIQKAEFDSIEQIFSKISYDKSEIEISPIKEVSKKNRRRLYFSRRFPFIHFGRRMKIKTMGRFYNPSE